VRSRALQDEVDARVEAMAVTGDICEAERGVTALEDIADMTADEHGCQTPAERRAWNRIRREARHELGWD